jgi:hypothetical protein
VPKTWVCKIGEVDAIGGGMDLPMRAAVERAYTEITGQQPEFIFSGWEDDALTEPERAVVENREPSAEYEAECGGAQWLSGSH